MDQLPIPYGFIAMEDHLVEWHGEFPENIRHCDSDELRRLHYADHKIKKFTSPSRTHTHYV